MAGLPEFARFVRSVEGYAVARFGTETLIGAERRALTREQRAAREPPIVWDTSTIVPLTKDYCRRYLRELNTAVRRGELIECTRAEWEAQQASKTPEPGPAPSGSGSETLEGTTEPTAAEAPQLKRRRGQEAEK